MGVVVLSRTNNRAYQRARAERLSMADGDVCGICGHNGVLTGIGAPQANHIVAHARGGDDSVENLEPAHGGNNPCVTCGRVCNQSLKAGPAIDLTYRSRDW